MLLFLNHMHVKGTLYLSRVTNGTENPIKLLVQLSPTKPPSDVFGLYPFCQNLFAVYNNCCVHARGLEHHLQQHLWHLQVQKAARSPAGISPRGNQARPYVPYLPPADTASQPGDFCTLTNPDQIGDAHHHAHGSKLHHAANACHCHLPSLFCQLLHYDAALSNVSATAKCSAMHSYRPVLLVGPSVPWLACNTCWWSEGCLHVLQRWS